MGKQAAQCFPIVEKKKKNGKKEKVFHPLASVLCLSWLGWEQAGLGPKLTPSFHSSYW